MTMSDSCLVLKVQIHNPDSKDLNPYLLLNVFSPHFIHPSIHAHPLSWHFSKLLCVRASPHCGGPTKNRKVSRAFFFAFVLSTAGWRHYSLAHLSHTCTISYTARLISSDLPLTSNHVWRWANELLGEISWQKVLGLTLRVVIYVPIAAIACTTLAHFRPIANGPSSRRWMDYWI